MRTFSAAAIVPKYAVVLGGVTAAKFALVFFRLWLEYDGRLSQPPRHQVRAVSPSASESKLKKPPHSDHRGLNGGLVLLDGDGMPILQSNATQQTSNFAPALVIHSGPEPGQLLARQPDDSDMEKYCTLQGPSGKGEHRLELESNPRQQEDMIGWEVESRGWTTRHTDGKALLRHDMPGGPSNGRWIAVPREEEGGVWEIWWLEPSPANCEHFERYVEIDLEMVAV